MIPISQVLPLVDRQLGRLQIGDKVQFKTFKKDRGFLICRVDLDVFQLIETGFNEWIATGDAARIRRYAKKALRREFPRSKKAWVTYHSEALNVNEVDESGSWQMMLF
ncbi:hypothetical protein J4N45_09005 [Vibrio sp. SCSIO 43140]|uniref:hypothetical protein n=1 Tax=Vibrio sp. SCSIO 43140 TaxID=2819100 RepID=UPI002075509E|nr:hypothetical protein [Vibrio sp. SCSIO 43140]USD62073.1 hypothetical protein J4N45_09005 [Vibrio sp. SCSIO 43140]